MGTVRRAGSDAARAAPAGRLRGARASFVLRRLGSARLLFATSPRWPSRRRWPISARGRCPRPPTGGQLDLETGRQIMRLILTVVRAEGITALVATHDEALIDLADEVLRLEDGHIVTSRRGQK